MARLVHQEFWPGGPDFSMARPKLEYSEKSPPTWNSHPSPPPTKFFMIKFPDLLTLHGAGFLP